MSTAEMNSLLDESDFLAELGSLEKGLTPIRRGRLEDTLPGVPVQDAPAVPASQPVLVVSRLAAFGFFVLMMAVGAAGALLVYHDRVGQLLSRIQ